METYLICLAAALVGGLMLSRLTKLLNLPAVTAYLVAGLILGPFCLGRLNVPGLGFNSLHQVEALSIITQTALGFIAFTTSIAWQISVLRTSHLSIFPAVLIPWQGGVARINSTLCSNAHLIICSLISRSVISPSITVTFG